VTETSAYSFDVSFDFRVTDFGVAEATSTMPTRFKDDFEQLADILRQLLATLNWPDLCPKDQYIFKKLRDEFTGRHLMEYDTTHDPMAHNPKEIYDEVKKTETGFSDSSFDDSKLRTPFEFLNCEQIGDRPALLHALYSERFLGLEDIESSNNVMVTGPRGCGKSTVFKSLSLDHKIGINKASPDQTSYIGIYYRCLDLSFAFPRYTKQEREEAINIPVHFITATLFSILLNSVKNWAEIHYNKEFRSNEGNFAAELWELIPNINPPQTPDRNTVLTVSNVLEKQRKRALEWQRFAHDRKREIGYLFGVDVLELACELLKKHFSFLRNRPIYFFIDDYSAPKVTLALQENLNRIFMQRSASFFFKLSTESPVSFSKNDIDGKTYVESREFILLNLGTEYLHASRKQKNDFIEDIFRRRLIVTQIKELVGLVASKGHINNNSIAQEIRDGKRITWWGNEVLCELCSGDIHYIISLVSGMVKKMGGFEGISEAGIPRDIQNKSIREAAGYFLQNLKAVPRHGEALLNIVESFGKVSYSWIKFKDSKNENNITPYQATRIEPYEHQTLSPEAQEIYNELLRYSVFIEDSRGKSIRGEVVSRLFLRRALIPHFNLTFSTHNSISLDARQFEEFLLKPENFEKAKKITETEDDSQLILFQQKDQK
jgi:energy-coupling factor transporter ATP-binding protein EcfA2